MIGYLKGVARGPQLLLVGGVGYLVTTLGGLTDGQDTELHVVSVIREDAFDLYGFAAEAEAALFKALMRANGVGAKLAMSMMRDLGPGPLARALSAGDTAALARAKGVGARTAATIAASVTVTDDLLADLGGAGLVPEAPADDLAVLLTGLGYKEDLAAQAAQEARSELGADADEAVLLRRAVVKLSA